MIYHIGWLSDWRIETWLPSILISHRQAFRNSAPHLIPSSSNPASVLRLHPFLAACSAICPHPTSALHRFQGRIPWQCVVFDLAGCTRATMFPYQSITLPSRTGGLQLPAGSAMLTLALTMLLASLSWAWNMQEFEEQGRLNDLFSYALQGVLAVGLLMYASSAVLHRIFTKSRRCNMQHLSSWSIRRRRFFSTRVVVLGWDLRANRAMVILWLGWVALNGYWSCVRQCKLPVADWPSDRMYLGAVGLTPSRVPLHFPQDIHQP